MNNPFGETVWNEVSQEFKATITNIGANPEAGKVIEELAELGEGNFRLRFVRQTRTVDEYDDKQVVVHKSTSPQVRPGSVLTFQHLKNLKPITQSLCGLQANIVPQGAWGLRIRFHDSTFSALQAVAQQRPPRYFLIEAEPLI